MRGSLQRSTVIVAILVGAAAPIRAQVASGPPASMDSAFARARALVASGNGAAGRLLVDSVLAATDPASPSYSDALYWHAMLASNDSDAERDYRRIVVEYALAPRAADALLQVAQLESARGDRSSAASHLARFFAENPSHPERARAGALLTRLLFEQNDLPHACSALRQTLAVLPDSAVETRNQLTYYAPRCTALDVSPGSRVPVSGGRGSWPAPRRPGIRCRSPRTERRRRQIVSPRGFGRETSTRVWWAAKSRSAFESGATPRAATRPRPSAGSDPRQSP